MEKGGDELEVVGRGDEGREAHGEGRVGLESVGGLRKGAAWWRVLRNRKREC